MKIKHSKIGLLARGSATLVLFTLALFFFACKGQGYEHNVPNMPSISYTEGDMTFQIETTLGSNKTFVPLTDVIPTSGIPYTATHRDVNKEGKLLLKAIAKINDAYISAEITGSKEGAPLNIKDVFSFSEKNVFELSFTEVKEPTPVTIRFSYSDKNDRNKRIYKDLVITVLPEPSIESVKGGELSLPIGLDYDLSEESVTFTCTPSKIGELDASKYLLKDSKKLSFKESSAPNVATVTQEGVLKTLTAGETNIKITSKNGKEGAIKVIVEDKKVIESISCRTPHVILSEGESQNIVLIPTPADSKLNLSEWQEDWVYEGERGAGKIEKKGGDEGTYTITALKKGKTKFSAHSKNNKNAKIEIELTVTDAKVQSIAISPPRISVGETETKQLTITATPRDASTAVKWESDKTDIVTVNDSGEITGVKKGSAIIKATSCQDETKTATCIVLVTEKIEKIELNKKVAELTFNETLQLTATVSPLSAPQGVNWSVEKIEASQVWIHASDMLKVDVQGLVTAQKERGYAKVIATSDTDPDKKAECIVSIAEEKVSMVKVNKSTVSMYTNAEEELTIEVFPQTAASKIAYNLEGDNLKVEDLKRIEHTNKYTCKLKSGSKEEKKTITFYALTNPEKKAEVKVTIIAPKVSHIIVPNQKIALTQTDAKMTANVYPKEATQTVSWTSEHPNICKVDATTGRLTPISKGEATIVATSTEDTSKKGRGTVTVLASLNSFTIKSIEPSFVHYGYDGSATITFETEPAGSFGAFTFECENKDLEFLPTSNQNQYKIRVKNKSAKEASASFTIRSSAAPSLPAQKRTIEVKSIVPKSLTIEGSDKMYLDETLEFSIKTNDATPKPDESVEWKLEKWISNAPLDQIQLEKQSYSNKIKVKLVGSDKKKFIGTFFKLVATSTLDKSLKAEKNISICENIAKIESVEYSFEEYTLTSTEKNSKLYNKGKIPTLEIKLKGDVENQYLVFVVTDKDKPTERNDYYNRLFSSNYIRLNTIDPLTKTATVRLRPIHNTKGEKKDFFIHPIDPKTIGEDYQKVPTVNYNYEYFFLLVWDEPKGIEVFKAENVGSGERSFNIYDKDDGGYESETITYGTSGYVFDVRTSPEYANPNYLEWETKRTSGNYMCILNPECSSVPDSNGKWRFKFNTNGDNTWAAHDYAKFLFYIRIPDENNAKQELSKPVSNYLLIDSN